MRLLPLHSRVMTVIDRLELVSASPHGTHFRIVKWHTERWVSYLTVTVRFEWRDLWLGAYYDDKNGRLYVCVVPMFPLVFEVRP